MKELPTGIIVWVAVVIIWAYYCAAWWTGPARVFQIWVVSIRAFYLWLFMEAFPGFFERWPRYEEIRTRVFQGDL